MFGFVALWAQSNSTPANNLQRSPRPYFDIPQVGNVLGIQSEPVESGENKEIIEQTMEQAIIINGEEVNRRKYLN